MNKDFYSKGETLYLISSVEAINYLEDATDSDFISSIRRIGGNGIFETLVESCKKNKLGFDITGDSELTDQEFLKGNTKYVAIVSVNEEQENDFVDFMFNHEIETTLLGHVTKGEFRYDGHSLGIIEDYLK
jgi:phosphoribosylformylglycinamidine (FGAM) synthase-like enzyme